MERIVARKLVQDLERRNALPQNQGGDGGGRGGGGGGSSMKSFLGKRCQIHIRYL